MKKLIKGISLIEILIVITIFSVLAILATRGVLITLRGARKSDTLGQVRENIAFTMEVMERLVRNADTVSCPSETQIAFEDKDATAGTFTCESVGSNGYVASSSARLTNQQVNITSCTFTCDEGSAGVPPSVIMSISGRDTTSSGVEGAQVTVSTTIFLRTY